ncbi:MAG TPA: PTS sugar transporter subunit IIA [Spirochaetales bacterium]|nr:PTS sugar transporter subunit IIA [Spirochaetales bacterium]MBP7262749.1 PTS sugar transporter subunit IIA [Spirochaetia bacterium]HPE35813.1 PTS sugar transporter subunit IIA [Spirochaetales bacterium]
MALIELLNERAIKVPLMARDKNGVIRELVDVLAAAYGLDNAENVFLSVLDREAQGSTGLSDGIAVPHGKTDAVPNILLAVGTAPDGVQFDAIDGQPSRLFFLMVAPPEKTGPHIAALAEIARLSRQSALCSALASAKSASEIMALMKGD